MVLELAFREGTEVIEWESDRIRMGGGMEEERDS